MTTSGLRNKLSNRSTLAARRAEDEQTQTQTRRSRRARRASDEDPVTAEGQDDLAEGEDDNIVEEETTTTTRRSRRGAKRGAKRGAGRRATDEEPVAEGEEEFAEGEEDYSAEGEEELAEGEEDFAEGEEDFAEGEDDLTAEFEEDEFAEGDDDLTAEGEEELAEDEPLPVSRRSRRAKRGARKATGAKATGERGRILAIMNSKYAAGRGKLAQFLALSTNVSPRLAINIMARAGVSTKSGTAPSRGNSVRGEAFRQAMGTVPNPRISSSRNFAQRTDEDDVVAGTLAIGRQLGRMPTQKKGQ